MSSSLPNPGGFRPSWKKDGGGTFSSPHALGLTSTTEDLANSNRGGGGGGGTGRSLPRSEGGPRSSPKKKPDAEPRDAKLNSFSLLDSDSDDEKGGECVCVGDVFLFSLFLITHQKPQFTQTNPIALPLAPCTSNHVK